MRVTSPRQLKNDYGDKVNFHSVQRFNQFRKVPNITADSVKAVDNNYLIRDHPYDADLIDGYVDLMVEVCCAGRETVRVNQEDVPAAVVQSQFLLLGLDSLELLHPVLNHFLGYGVNLLFLFDVGGTGGGWPFMRILEPTYRILSRSYVVLLLLPAHLRRCCSLLTL